MSNLFRNQTYIGEAHWGASYAVVPEKPLKDEKYKKIEKTSRRMNPTDKWMTIKVPRLIDDDDLFYRANQRLRENFAVMDRNKKNDYLLAGKIWCTCGKRRTGEGPKRGKHLYYRCNNRVYMHPLPRTCKENGINARIADKAVWERLKTILSTPSLLKTQAGKYLMGSKTNGISTLGIDIESTKNEILRLEGKENKYADAYSEGVISIEKLKEFVVPLGERIILLKKNLAQAYAEQKPKLETMQPTNEEIELFTKEVSGFLNNLSFASKKVIIQKAVTKVYSTQKDLQVHGSINLNELHVFLFSDDRYCWFAERGEVHAF